MLGLFKDTPVIGKASTIIQVSNEKLFDFIGVNLLSKVYRGVFGKLWHCTIQVKE